LLALLDTSDKSLKNKLQTLQNHAAEVITGASYFSSSVVLRELNPDTLNVRCAKLKSVRLYKVLNENSAQRLTENLVKHRDLEG
jgi:hypothetical protein